MLSPTDRGNTEYGTELLMKSGTTAVSGWQLSEQTECPRETVETNTHLVRSKGVKPKNVWEKDTEEKRGERHKRELEKRRCGETGDELEREREGWSRDGLRCTTAAHHLLSSTRFLQSNT